MTQPVKRGPGRPRKQPAPPAEPAEVTPDAVAAETVQDDEPAKKSDADPRIGSKCDPAWSSVGYDDGSTYRCENGKIVERTS